MAVAVAGLAGLGLVSAAQPGEPTVAAGSPGSPPARGALPLSFEANRGQAPPEVAFLARLGASTLFLTRQEAVLEMRPDPHAPSTPPVRWRAVGANPDPVIEGTDRLPGLSNYLIGSDPSGWHVGIPTFAGVALRDVYPGIDTAYHGDRGAMEYDFAVAAGADPRRISLEFSGQRGLTVNEAGDLLVETGGGVLTQHAPVAYQIAGGPRRQVSARYALAGGARVSLALGAYDSSRPLLIDPVIAYSTYLGGSSSMDKARAVALDSSGSAYVAGTVVSADFPTVHPVQARKGGLGDTTDAFITKFNPQGSALLYSTYLGGRSYEDAYGIAVDSSGSAYVVGQTTSPDFPQTHPLSTGGTAFITKLDPSGASLVYSARLGGSHTRTTEGTPGEVAHGIALDASGDAYIAGTTNTVDFPTVTPYQGSNRATRGENTVFVAKVNPTGSALLYATYLGGSSGADQAAGIAVDGQGSAYVTGTTESADFPVTPGGFQRHMTGSFTVFVTKLTPGGSGLAYSTFLGGGFDQHGNAIAVDGSGSAYVAGDTVSTDFPTRGTPYPVQSTLAKEGVSNAFITKFDPTGGGLVYSTYLGGTGTLSNGDAGLAVALDPSGSALVTGQTTSTDFPTRGDPCPLQSANGGGAVNRDGFVTRLDPAGSAVVYSSYLGGSGTDQVNGIAVDARDHAYLVGETDSADFPTKNPYTAKPRAAFVTEITPGCPIAPTVVAVQPASDLVTGGGPVTVTGLSFIGATSVAFGAAGTITRRCRGAPGTGRDPCYTILSDTSLQVFEPAAPAPMTVHVQVTNPVGTSLPTPLDLFTYLPLPPCTVNCQPPPKCPPACAPAIAKIDPVAGPVAGGTAIDVKGSGLSGALRIRFTSLPPGSADVTATCAAFGGGPGAAPCFAPSVTPDTELTVYSPAAPAPLTTGIVVTTPLGTSPDTPADRFQYRAGIVNPPPPPPAQLAAVARGALDQGGHLTTGGLTAGGGAKVGPPNAPPPPSMPGQAPVVEQAPMPGSSTQLVAQPLASVTTGGVASRQGDEQAQAAPETLHAMVRHDDPLPGAAVAGGAAGCVLPAACMVLSRRRAPGRRRPAPCGAY